MTERRPTLTLISRVYCHLCDEMHAELLSLFHPPPFALVVLDVDENQSLLEKFDELVPVLLDNESEELCHYHLDGAKVSEYLRRFE